jgi:hypothetical protein
MLGNHERKARISGATSPAGKQSKEGVKSLSIVFKHMPDIPTLRQAGQDWLQLRQDDCLTSRVDRGFVIRITDADASIAATLPNDTRFFWQSISSAPFDIGLAEEPRVDSGQNEFEMFRVVAR